MKSTKLFPTFRLNFLLLASMGMFLFMTASCEKDVPGCTDANAENYNADATEDDGTCVLARAKFLGTYNVNETCTSGTYNYTITITESGTSDDAIIITPFGNYENTSVRATVSGAGISFNDTQNAITFSGSGDITGNSLSIIYTASQAGIQDNCTKTAIKQ